MKTNLFLADNSGALLAQCIKVFKKKKNIGVVGDLIIVTIKKAYPRKKVKKHDMQHAVIVRTKKSLARKNIGMNISFNSNAVVLLDKKNNPIGNRIKGTVTRELRYRKLMKILTLASSVI
jgi:large subunit ribosomal protein L14